MLLPYMQFLKIIGILRVLGLYILFSFNKGEIMSVGKANMTVDYSLNNSTLGTWEFKLVVTYAPGSSV